MITDFVVITKWRSPWIKWPWILPINDIAVKTLDFIDSSFCQQLEWRNISFQCINMARAKKFSIFTSCFSVDLLESPRGPATIKWIKNSPQIFWLPPLDVTITNDFHYIIEVEQNGQWTMLGVTTEPTFSLMHLNCSKKHKLRVNLSFLSRLSMRYESSSKNVFIFSSRSEI